MSTTLEKPINDTQNAKLVYTAKAHTTGGRDGGASQTSDGRLDVKFSVPGGPGTGTNPEQLLATGWSACFLSAMGHIARTTKITLPKEAAIDTEVQLYSENGGYFLGAHMNISLPGLDRETAQSIIDGAEKLCPYSKATRGNIDVTIVLV